MMSIKAQIFPTDVWQFTDPAQVGVDPQKLSILDQILNTKYTNLKSIVIVKNGQIIYEKYKNGYGPQDRFHVASVTKSFTSALIGIAIQAGFLDGEDQKVLDFFPDYQTGPADLNIRLLTIRHLLTMTAPFPWKGYEPLDRLRRQPDWSRYILDSLNRRSQFGKFQYSTGGTHILSAIITRATGVSALEFANENLFKLIDMPEIQDHEMEGYTLDDVFGKRVRGWIKDPQGNTAGGWGLTLSPRDMARFGLLYLNQGMWNGSQIIPSSWVEKSISPTSEHYGYLWWLNNDDADHMVAALGSGGNAIIYVPEKDLVVAATAPVTSKAPDPWELVSKHILPAINTG